MPQTNPLILELLLTPSTYPHPVKGDIIHLETHISHIFLTGNFTYKIKKPVNMEFLDFTNLNIRRQLCLKELKLNRRLCPKKLLYIDVLGIIITPYGLHLTPLTNIKKNTIISEYCLKMIQMDPNRMMEILLIKKQINKKDISKLINILIKFYNRNKNLSKIALFGKPEQIRNNLEENFFQIKKHQTKIIPQKDWQSIHNYTQNFLTTHWKLFETRVKKGYIRDGHGDLHSGNINFPIAQQPIIYDCIEFNDRFRFQDIAADLAFLAMDLDVHKYQNLSNFLIEEYIRASGDKELKKIIIFYKCYRALVRTKIYIIMINDQKFQNKFYTLKQQANSYLQLALSYSEKKND